MSSPPTVTLRPILHPQSSPSMHHQVSSHIPTALTLSSSPTSPLYFRVGRRDSCEPAPDIVPSPDEADPPPGLQPELVDLEDPSRGTDEQRASRNHAVLKLTSDGLLFVRDWKYHDASRRTRVFLPGSDDFIVVSPSSWTPRPHSSTVRFVSQAPPISAPAAQFLPYHIFSFTVDSPVPVQTPDAQPDEEFESDGGLFSASDDDREESDYATPSGMFAFKFLVPSSKFGVLTGVKGAVIKEIRTSTQCNLQWSTQHSFFPGSQDRVLLVTAPVLSLLQRGCAAVVDRLGNDRGRDGTQALPEQLCVRAAYPHHGPLASLCDEERSSALAAFGGELSCDTSISRKLSRRGDSIVTFFGALASVAGAVKQMVAALPIDCYTCMLPDYTATARPDAGGAQRRRMHKDEAHSRERRARDAAEQGPQRKRGRGSGSGQSHPRKPSNRFHQSSDRRRT